MHKNRYGLATLAIVGLFALSGANCPRNFTPWWSQAPEQRVLPPNAGLEQVIQAVNNNNSRIQSFSSSSASLSGPGYPTLRANIAFQRPNFFRLRGETGITGSEVDLGSNDQLFWFWVRRNNPPAVFYCRHDQFDASRAKAMIPIDPNWLIDAMGVSLLDPALPHQGPYPVKGNRLEIRTVRNTPEGPSIKATVIDAATACVMEQRVYDPRGHLQASAVAEGYRRDPLSGLFMPTAIRLECPAAQFSMRVDLGSVQVNKLQGNPAELWSLPNYPGSPLVNLGDPNLQFGAPPTAPRQVPPMNSMRPPLWR